MLFRLDIENVAVIEKVGIKLNTGFNVLSGETGAGKSILIDSIDLVLGERASKELIRSGEKKAYVGANFIDVSDKVTDICQEYGIEVEDNKSLLIEREIYSDGRNMQKINNRPVTLSVLKNIGKYLVNMHGQHSNQLLLDEKTHIEYLDKFANNENERAEYIECYNNVYSLQKEINTLNALLKDKDNTLEYLNYLINEIENANVTVGEEKELTDRRLSLINSEKILSKVNYALNKISADFGLCDSINEVYKSLTEASKFDSELNESVNEALVVSDKLFELKENLNTYVNNYEFSENELEETEQRLDLISKLKRKYGGSEESILETLSKAKKELIEIQNSTVNITDLSEKLQKEKAKLVLLANRLSETRLKNGKKFETLVMNELKFLDMEKVKFSVSVKDRMKPNGKIDFQKDGKDEVEFYIMANAGEDFKKLSKIASGGELSRIMLAVKTVLSSVDNVDTLIFDEIDTGVSGKTAEKIGIKLKEAGTNRQILCVTHLAQIASKADTHLLITKSVSNDRTFTNIQELDYNGRVNELSRIIGGINITEATIQTAKDMLKI